MRPRRKLGGLFKRCGCRATQWPKCPHPYWFAFKPTGAPQVRESLGVAALDEAKALRDKRRVEARAAAAGAAPRDLRLTVDDAAERYAKAREEKGKDHYLDVLRRLEIPGPKGVTITLGSKPLADVTADDVEAALAAYRRRVIKRQAGGKVGERKLLQTGRHLFNWSIKKKLTTHTPFRINGVAVDEIKPAPSGGRDRRLEEGEEERLLAAADQYTRDTIVAILDTGLRGGTLRQLQWRDVQGDRIAVPKEKQKRGKRTLIKPIKSARLREVLDRRRIGPDGQEFPEDAFVFGKSDGTAMPRRLAHELWAATRKGAGIEGLNFHDLRAEHGSELLESGVDIEKVSKALGHTTITMTQAYLRSRVGSQDAAYERLEAARAARVVDIESGRRRAG